MLKNDRSSWHGTSATITAKASTMSYGKDGYVFCGLRATDGGGAQTNFWVRVRPQANITVNPSAVTLTVGQTFTPTSVTVTPSGAYQSVVWRIRAGTGSCTLQNAGTGRVQASSAGTCYLDAVSAYDNTRYGTCVITVQSAPTPTPQPSATPTQTTPIYNQGVYRIKNAATGNCLSVVGNTLAVNSTLNCSEFDPQVEMERKIIGKRNQFWRLEYIASGEGAGCYKLWANELSFEDPYITRNGANIRGTNYGEYGRRVLSASRLGALGEIFVDGDYSMQSPYFAVTQAGDGRVYLRLIIYENGFPSITNRALTSTEVNDNWKRAYINTFSPTAQFQWELELVGYKNYTMEFGTEKTPELPVTQSDKMMSDAVYNSAPFFDRWKDPLLQTGYLAVPGMLAYYRGSRPIACENLDWFFHERGKTKETMHASELITLMDTSNEILPSSNQRIHSGELERLQEAANFFHQRKPAQQVSFVSINESNYELKHNSDWFYAVGNFRTCFEATVNQNGGINYTWHFRDFYDWDPARSQLFATAFFTGLNLDPGEIQTYFAYLCHVNGIRDAKNFDIRDQVSGSR